MTLSAERTANRKMPPQSESIVSRGIFVQERSSKVRVKIGQRDHCREKHTHGIKVDSGQRDRPINIS